MRTEDEKGGGRYELWLDVAAILGDDEDLCGWRSALKMK